MSPQVEFALVQADPAGTIVRDPFWVWRLQGSAEVRVYQGTMKNSISWHPSCLKVVEDPMNSAVLTDYIRSFEKWKS